MCPALIYDFTNFSEILLLPKCTIENITIAW